MELKAINLNTKEKVNIISNDKEVIADIILKDLCNYGRVIDGDAYYSSNYNLEIENLDEITDYIISSSACQMFQIIHCVCISIYQNNHLLTELFFGPKIK